MHDMSQAEDCQECKILWKESPLHLMNFKMALSGAWTGRQYYGELGSCRFVSQLLSQYESLPGTEGLKLLSVQLIMSAEEN